METSTFFRRLPLDGTRNTRDLGGYPCEGGATNWKAFVRSDNPANLTEKDMDFLRGYGITDVVDLRHDDERQRSPSSLCGADGFTVHAISIHNEQNTDFEGDVPGSMSGMYISLLENAKAELVQVFNAMAGARGGVLFHCAVGKDRTGVTAMLLLKLAGAADADVVADYAITEVYMTEIFEAQAQVFRANQVPDYILRSVPASAERVLAHLAEHYGTAEAYLRSIGLGDDAIKTLKGKLCG